MAKKTKTKVEVKEPQVQEEVAVETAPVVKQPKVTRKEPSYKKAEDGWEIKNRTYYLRNGLKPLSYMIKSANIYYFDEQKGYERELKYCENQKTPFVDEMKGDQRLEHIIFRGGTLLVEKEKVVLQKLLSLYHPHRDKLFAEYVAETRAQDQMEVLELEVDALIAARSIDIETAEAVTRVEIGSKVSQMTSRELKRDILIYAKKNPKLFLELVGDENIKLRNFGIKATEMGILRLSSDQRTFSWGSNDRKLMNVPFDEHPYSALAAWFKTDEGMEIYSNIEKRLNS